jgi:hypothetical protein
MSFVLHIRGTVNFTDYTTAMMFISQCRYCPVRFPGAIFWFILFRVHPGYRQGTVTLQAHCEINVRLVAQIHTISKAYGSCTIHLLRLFSVKVRLNGINWERPTHLHTESSKEQSPF